MVTELVELILEHVGFTAHLVFTLDESFPNVLHQVDLNTITLCPVYISVLWDVEKLLFVLREPLWDWDKYLASRTHVVFNLGPTRLTADALKARENGGMCFQTRSRIQQLRYYCQSKISSDLLVTYNTLI